MYVYQKNSRLDFEPKTEYPYYIHNTWMSWISWCQNEDIVKTNATNLDTLVSWEYAENGSKYKQGPCLVYHYH